MATPVEETLYKVGFRKAEKHHLNKNVLTLKVIVRRSVTKTLLFSCNAPHHKFNFSLNAVFSSTQKST